MLGFYPQLAFDAPCGRLVASLDRGLDMGKRQNKDASEVPPKAESAESPAPPAPMPPAEKPVKDKTPKNEKTDPAKKRRRTLIITAVIFSVLLVVSIWIVVYLPALFPQRRSWQNHHRQLGHGRRRNHRWFHRRISSLIKGFQQIAKIVGGLTFVGILILQGVFVPQWSNKARVALLASINNKATSTSPRYIDIHLDPQQFADWLSNHNDSGTETVYHTPSTYVPWDKLTIADVAKYFTLTSSTQPTDYLHEQQQTHIPSGPYINLKAIRRHPQISKHDQTRLPLSLYYRRYRSIFSASPCE